MPKTPKSEDSRAIHADIARVAREMDGWEYDREQSVDLVGIPLPEAGYITRCSDGLSIRLEAVSRCLPGNKRQQWFRVGIDNSFGEPSLAVIRSQGPAKIAAEIVTNFLPDAEACKVE